MYRAICKKEPEVVITIRIYIYIFNNMCQESERNRPTECGPSLSSRPHAS